jgi:hypothetical protein
MLRSIIHGSLHHSPVGLNGIVLNWLRVGITLTFIPLSWKKHSSTFGEKGFGNFIMNAGPESSVCWDVFTAGTVWLQLNPTFQRTYCAHLRGDMIPHVAVE